MKSTLSIDVTAPPDLVFRLAHDVRRWPALLPHYRSATVERRDGDALVVRFVARRPLPGPLGLGLPVAWRSRTWAEPELHRIRFRHQGGATDGMDVTWTIDPTADGAHVAIHHVFDAPGPWPAFVNRYFTRPIARRTLATFKALAEAVHESTTASPDEPAT